ncbi:MAG TPA: HAD family hydrolase [Methylophilus sp.]
MKKLLVLDLDETLVHANHEKPAHDDYFKVANYYVHKRPNLDWFIKEMLTTFKIGVWTASSEMYAEIVTNELFSKGDLEFVWANKRCTLARSFNTGEYDVIKNLRKLKKLGYPMESIIMVDDTASKHVKNYGNLVLIKEFKGDQNDDELVPLANYLEHLARVPNIRNVEKRNWKAQLDL